ncbi:MAG TPA: class I lanthipeptide [Thermoanaerobaculia bacterium]|nr:class I lanthipeptide [Thermoanaerobaculia bacterium]
MKKLQKRIVLDRETVRRLDAPALGAVAGGYNYSTGNICHTYTCSTTPAC